MRSAVKQLLIGFLPLLLGMALAWLSSVLPYPGWVGILLSCVFLFAWGACAYWAASAGENSLLQALCMSAVGLVMLLLVLIQELALKKYWPNAFGWISQAYFLPGLPLPAAIAGMVWRRVAVWPIYIGVIVCQLAAAWIGCERKRRS